jgi:hypothetical protein
MNNINNTEKPVILFIPEVGIYPFARGLAVLGDAIVKQGGRVFVTRDTGQMLRSPIMAMNNLSIIPSETEIKKIRKANEKIFTMIQKEYEFSSIELADFVNDELMEEIDELVCKENCNLEDIKYRGFPVGKIAQYDFVLETKFPYSKKLSNKQKILYIQYIKNTVLTIALVDGICEKYDPSLFITFNEYAQCQAVRYSASKHGVSRMAMTYPTHFNVDASRFMLWSSTCESWRYKHCQNWDSGKNIPIKKEDVLECWNDAIFRMFSSGSHIFSSRKKSDTDLIFKKLCLDPNKKTIVVYTSSQDERESVEIAMKIWGETNEVHDAFKNQIDWLSELREYTVERKDIQIVVRIHPREGTRGRGFSSKHLQLLHDKFKENTKSFIIIWPDDPISSYDLMELADVCLVAWSLMGQEAARIGIPVLSFVANMFYPDDDFMQVAATPQEYKKKLYSILDMKYEWQHLVKAIRFYHWRIFILSLNLGDFVPADVQDDTIWPKVPDPFVSVINDILAGKQDLIEYNIEKWQQNLSEDSLIKESKAVAYGIRFFLDKIYYPPVSYKQKFLILYRVYKKIKKEIIKLFRKVTGKKYTLTKKDRYSFLDYDLEYTTDISNLKGLCEKTKKNKKLRIIAVDGRYAILIHNGKMLSRMSFMVVRLAGLHNSYQKGVTSFMKKN